jgi:hypothetical protein
MMAEAKNPTSIQETSAVKPDTWSDTRTAPAAQSAAIDPGCLPLGVAAGRTAISTAMAQMTTAMPANASVGTEKGGQPGEGAKIEPRARGLRPSLSQTAPMTMYAICAPCVTTSGAALR